MGIWIINFTICRANGRPIMTEHLNKRFKEILTEMKDPDIDPQEVYFQPASYQRYYQNLMSGGDYKFGYAGRQVMNLEMLTRCYGKHSLPALSVKSWLEKMDEFLDGKGRPSRRKTIRMRQIPQNRYCSS